MQFDVKYAYFNFLQSIDYGASKSICENKATDSREDDGGGGFDSEPESSTQALPMFS